MNYFSLESILAAFGHPESLLHRASYTMTYLGVNLYYPETQLFRHCLYIVEGSAVPAPLLEGPYGCILIPASEQFRAGRLAAETVIWPEHISGGLLLNQIQNLHLSQSSQAHMAHMLMSSLSLKASVSSVIHQAAMIMQNAILLLDPAYQLIAMESLGCEIDDIFWKDCCENQRVSDEHILLIKNSGLTKVLEQARNVSLWQEQDYFNNIPRLAQKIYSADNIYLGTITVFRCKHEFTEDDYFLLDALVEMLSSSLNRYEYLTAAQKTDSELLLRLAKGGEIGALPGEAKRRFHAIKDHQFFLAGFISLRNDPSLSRLGAYLQAALLSEQDCILSTLQGKNVIVLIYFEDFKQIRSMRQWLRAKLSPLCISIGLSPVFTDITQFALQLSLAESAGDLGISHDMLQLDPVCQYQNISCLQLFDAMLKSDLKRYVLHSPAAILWSGNHYEAYKTLKCFVMNLGSYSKTAQALFIHKNTLLYRLSKIQALTGIDYTAAEDLLAASLSFAVWEYLNDNIK